MKQLLGISILVVDDEPEMLSILCDVFEDEGACIQVAEGGHIALNCLKQGGGVDVVLSDICMPEGDGLELLKNILSTIMNPPPVILHTGCFDIKFEKAKELGAFDLLVKPANSKTLVEAIIKAMTHSKLKSS